ncbi:MAG: FGGY family carbohydrate kinase [Ignavibacteriales bacterium]|nr:FGGY family carbohydrate kinase [Ignavibacteriales bacterium]
MKKKTLLGFDIGSSSIKASLLNADTGEVISSGSSPEVEMAIDAPQSGWAEQYPAVWWQHVVNASNKIFCGISSGNFEVAGIGISYQMHGLVVVDKDQKVLHPSIIWCDSRAVDIGNKAAAALGVEFCLKNYLNTPGNFTASKLKWIREQRPEIYERIDKIMLPGDYIAMMLTGEIRTTISGLSEGIFWDFEKKTTADALLAHYGIEKRMLAELAPTFGDQGALSANAALVLGLTPGIPVAYRAGDQPNNAFSLNVLHPGEAATTAGTSGVIYGVTDKNLYDLKGRVNTFAHVNYTSEHPNLGVLLCINGTGIQYSWLKRNLLDNKYSYPEMNELAAEAPIGSEGLMCFPYGNGAERSLESKDVHGHFSGISFNLHDKRHLVRAAQEGIVFTFRYGLDVMRKMGMHFREVKAGHTNLFLSRVFREAFVNTCNVGLEMFNTDGSQGAARGAGIGIGYYSSALEAFSGLQRIERMEPRKEPSAHHEEAYQRWKEGLERLLR